jgi:putative membrane protein
MMMFEPKRIHPVGVILSFIKMIKSYIIPVFLFFFFGNYEKFEFFITIGITVIFFLIVIVSFLDWWKFTYWLEAGELRIEYGVFVKKKRYIPIERIQTINISAGIIQQIFRLVKVQVETAGGGMEAEAVLTAVKQQEAERIQNAIASYKQDSLQSSEDPSIEKLEHPAYKIKPKDLLVAASTSSGIGVVLSAVAAFLSQFDDFIPYEDIFHQFDFLEGASFTIYAVLVFIAFFIAWVISIIGVLLKYAYFTLIKEGEELKISRGIFEKHQVSIPTSRIQAIRIVQNPLRQLLGYATIYIESAGSGAADEGSSVILFPIVSKKEVAALLSQYLPLFMSDDITQKLPKRSMVRYIFRKVIPIVIICIPVIYFLSPWGWLLLILLPIAAYWGYSSYKDSGWHLSGNQLHMQFRVFSKTSVLVYRNRLQSIKSKTSYFQKKRFLKTFQISIKSGIVGKQFTIKDIEQNDLETLVEWYSYSKGNDK